MSLYEALGGEKVLASLIRSFYHQVYHDSLLRPLFPDDRRRVEQAQLSFLTQLTGGPRNLNQEPTSLAMIHRLLPIRREHAVRWLALMEKASIETIANEEARLQLMERLQIGAMNVLRVCEAHQMN
ncbi:truncated hemoglobin [Exiguobacterium sp. TDN 0502]|uniref:globin domain-containing protein n=1 Tax=Exiguobacterium sp. TDN 0502 TaxID=3420731 RepID=UPI003D7730CD